MSGAAEREAKALVLFSGGQDSTTCLAWALDRFTHVETVGFFYGQRHRIELECRAPIRAALDGRFHGTLGPDHLIDIEAGLAALGATAMTADIEIETSAEGLPTTFVPGRNLLFMTYAGALAHRRGIGRLVGGMCETDFSGYPDCRDDTLKALQVTLNLGMARRFVIDTPLMWLDKAETWALAHRLGGDALIDLVREATHTCYLGARETLHGWGRGCGTCPACKLRADGYVSWTASLRDAPIS
jgi:7-cyano-7-deazaguanine synthase